MFITKGSQKILVLTVATMSIFMSGCTANPNNVKQQGAPIKQQQVQQPSNDDNRIQIANEAAAKIAKQDSVKQANVLVTKRNAYVAAVLKNDQPLTRDIEDQIANRVGFNGSEYPECLRLNQSRFGGPLQYLCT